MASKHFAVVGFVCAATAFFGLVMFASPRVATPSRPEGEVAEALGARSSRVAEVALGDATGCARLADGSVWCWPRGGARARAARVAGVPSATTISVAPGAACLADVGGQLWCW